MLKTIQNASNYNTKGSSLFEISGHFPIAGRKVPSPYVYSKNISWSNTLSL